MQWGQYLDHDLTSTPMERSANGSILDCSRCESLRQNSACFPIFISSTDTFYGTAVKRCIPFTRSLPGQLSLGPREQVNRVTPLLDASSVYGSTQCYNSQLRNGSELLSTLHPKSPHIFKTLMPRKEVDECVAPSGKCFQGGDDRSSEQPGLTSIHTIFMRGPLSTAATLELFSSIPIENNFICKLCWKSPFLTPFSHTPLLYLCFASQMALLEFYLDSSLFTSPVTSHLFLGLLQGREIECTWRGNKKMEGTRRRRRRRRRRKMPKSHFAVARN